MSTHSLTPSRDAFATGQESNRVLSSRLFWKLFASFTLVILAFAAGLVTIVANQYETKLEQQTRRRVESVLSLVVPIVEHAAADGELDSGVLSSLAGLPKNSRLRIDIVDASGHGVSTVVANPSHASAEPADTVTHPVNAPSARPGPIEERVPGHGEAASRGPARAERPSHMPPPLPQSLQVESRPLPGQNATTQTAGDSTPSTSSPPSTAAFAEEVQQAFAGRRTSARHEDTASGRNMFWIAEPLDLPSGTRVVVRVGADLEEIQRNVRAMRQHIWLLASGAVLSALLLMYLLVGRIIRPLATLTGAARDLARGNETPEVHVTNRDEVGELARAFNLMSHQLAERIAELEKHQQQADGDRQRLETVLGGMVDGVVAVDQRERILFINRAASRHFDIGGRSGIGRPLWEIVRNPRLQTVVREELTNQTGERTPDVVELEFPRTKTVVALYVSRLPGTPCPGVVVVLHDMTELRRLENLRREFVSNVSHELKTPLASIQAFAGTLLGGALEDESVNRVFLERIEEQTERLGALIQDMLSLQKIESGREAFQIVPVDVQMVVATLVEIHAPRAQAKNVQLRIGDSPASATVLGDFEAVRTLLENLVDNAIKYTPSGGSVTVRWAIENAFAVISVSDTGLGIPRDQQQRVFERFYRVDKARSRDVGGTGLGLSIVKHLAQVFGGSVSLSSSPGQGSTFTVRLPLTDTQATAHSSQGMPFSS